MGHTSEKEFRLEDFASDAHLWTTLHPPLEIQNMIPLDSLSELDEIVLDYMEEYGIANVRGGSYSDILLTHGQLEQVEEKLKEREEKDARYETSSSAWGSESDSESGPDLEEKV